MSVLLNIFWGWMVTLRVLAIAAIPLGLVAAIYLGFVYFVWSHIFGHGFQDRHPETSWIFSAASIIIITAITFGMHELGADHRKHHQHA